ncbi:hypothetical protein YH62_06985 [Rhizobium sp. LC145]|nr:hypothetical protein YH62_06985 [Rhizobium sp. LC145]
MPRTETEEAGAREEEDKAEAKAGERAKETAEAKAREIAREKADEKEAPVARMVDAPGGPGRRAGNAKRKRTQRRPTIHRSK